MGVHAADVAFEVVSGYAFAADETCYFLRIALFLAFPLLGGDDPGMGASPLLLVLAPAQSRRRLPLIDRWEFPDPVCLALMKLALVCEFTDFHQLDCSVLVRQNLEARVVVVLAR